MLTMFEHLNTARLPEGPLRIGLEQTIRAQRAVPDHLPG